MKDNLLFITRGYYKTCVTRSKRKESKTCRSRKTSFSPSLPLLFNYFLYEIKIIIHLATPELNNKVYLYVLTVPKEELQGAQERGARSS